MNVQGYTVAVVMIGLIVLAGVAVALPPEAERVQRAEELLEGVELEPAQREAVIDRLVHPGRYLGPPPEEEGEEEAGQAERRAQAEAFLRDDVGLTSDELQRLAELYPREYNQTLHRIDRGLKEVQRARRRHPARGELMQEAMRLELQSQQLGRQYRRGSTAAQQRLETALRETLNAYFDVKMQLRKNEIDRVREELDRLEQQVKQREEQRDLILERQFMIETGQGDPYTP